MEIDSKTKDEIISILNTTQDMLGEFESKTNSQTKHTILHFISVGIIVITTLIATLN